MLAVGPLGPQYCWLFAWYELGRQAHQGVNTLPSQRVPQKILKKSILQLDQTQRLVQALSSQLADLRDQMTEQRKHKQRMGEKIYSTFMEYIWYRDYLQVCLTQLPAWWIWVKGTEAVSDDRTPTQAGCPPYLGCTQPHCDTGLYSMVLCHIGMIWCIYTWLYTLGTRCR